MNRTPLGCLLVFATLTFSHAQSAPAAKSPSGPTKDPVSTALRLRLTGSEKNTVAAIDAMPADKFSYKPTADQMTFAHLAAHIAEANNVLCSKAADVPAPKAAEAKDTDSKEVLVAAVKASYSFCSDALGKMDDSKLGDSVDVFGHQAPRSLAVLILAGAWADHYSTAAMYLRLNNILPPSAQPKK
jgi:hypothetical protein